MVSIPRTSDAQHPGKAARIGFLAAISEQSAQPSVRAFREALREHGWIEGRPCRSSSATTRQAGLGSVSARAAFVIDKAGVVQYSEQTPTPKELPNFNAIKETLAKLK